MKNMNLDLSRELKGKNILITGGTGSIGIGLAKQLVKYNPKEIRIFSNDEDESEVICETNGNINGANIGQEAPDFNLDIVANGTGSFQLSDYLGSVIVIAFFSPS